MNITNTDKPVHITFGSQAGLIDIIQFPARFRRRPPSITLLHSQAIGRLVYFDELQARKSIVTLCQVYQRMDALYPYRRYDELSAKRQRINVERKDGIIRDASGSYQVDEYSLLSKKLESLDRNARHNRLVLVRILEAYNFSLVSESTYGTGLNEADSHMYNQVTEQLKIEKKLYTEAILTEMLEQAEAYAYRQQPADPIRYKLENRLRFLTEFLSVASVRMDSAILRSAGFRQFGRRIAFLLVEQDKALAKQLPAQVLHENELFHQLKAQLVVGQIYSQAQLKDLVATVPGLGYTPKTYLTAIKVLFHVRAQYTTVAGKNARVGYTIEKAISWHDYDYRPSLGEARLLDYSCLSELT